MLSKNVLKLSLPNAALITYASIVGLSTPGFYTSETVNWQAQSIGQDAIDLFVIIPALIITAIFATKKHNVALLLWAGINFYLIYTFIIYSFDIHFNKLFIIYCLVLGISFYSFLYFLVSQINEPIAKEMYGKTVVKMIAAYFFVISCLFCFLWLSEIIPSIIKNRTPEGVADTGLFTNPVQVIDLSVVLPGFFLTSLLILQKKPPGLLLIPVILTFCILMNITIGSLIISMKLQGIDADYSITLIMTFLSLLSTILLICYFRTLKHLTTAKELN